MISKLLSQFLESIKIKDSDTDVKAQRQEQKAPLSETVKLISLENSLKSIKQETVIEERDSETGEIINYRKLFVLKL
ncbi:MAG: hypothetical protein ACTSPM_12735 [Candidatus Heimdallarchaeota archaeon]